MPTTRIARVVSMIVASSVLATAAPDGARAGSTGARRIARHKITVVLVEGPGRHRWKISRADVAQIVRLTDDYWSRLSQGRIRLELKRVVSWKRRPQTATCSSSIARAIGRQIGFRPGIDGHLVALQALSDPSECPGRAGEAELGGRYIWMGEPQWSVLAHEFGHNIGLGHTNGPGCSTGPFRLCSVRRDLASGFAEYGGRDLMGSGTGTLPSPSLVALGLITRAQVKSINLATARDTTVSLVPLSTGKGTLAVRLRWRNDEVWFSYDVRDGLTSGIQVHTVRSRRVFELPVDRAGVVQATGLLAGGTYPLPRGRVSVTSLGDTAQLVFNFGTLPNVRVVPGRESADVYWNPGSLPPEDDLVVRVVSPSVAEPEPGDASGLYPVVLTVSETTVKAGAGHLTLGPLSPSTAYRASIFHKGVPVSASRPFQVRPDSARVPEWTLAKGGGTVRISFRPSSDAHSIEYADVYACTVTKSGTATLYQTMHQAIRAGDVAYLDWTPRRTGVTALIHFDDGTVLEQVLVKSVKAGSCPSSRDFGTPG